MLLWIGVPFTLATGFLGVLPGFFIGLISGLVFALWDTHNPFTPLEFALLASLFGTAIRQRYSAFEFRLLRRPFISALLISMLYPLIALYSNLFYADGDLANRLDYAFSNLSWNSLAMAGQLLIAGVVCTGAAMALPTRWGGQGVLHASPMERSLPFRFLYSMTPLAIMLLLTLLVGNWYVAGNAAQKMLENRMQNSARLAAETIPFFLETGHSLIAQIAQNPDWLTGTAEQESARLQSAHISVPFFNQMILLDASGELFTQFPENSPELFEVERVGLELALLGVPIQNYTIPPLQSGDTPYISFIAVIADANELVKGVLIGRADITVNPFTRPILFNLNSMRELGGEGVLLDSDNRVLYNSNQSGFGTQSYPVPEETIGIQELILDQPVGRFYEDKSPDGTRRLVFYQPAVGQPWSVVLALPAQQSQQLALSIAAPMLVMILVAFLFAGILLAVGLRLVTQSLENLAFEANRIAEGQLDHPLVVSGEDEVGRLSRAFEQMRISLKNRLDELNRLLAVSQGVASSLDMNEAVKPVLESALTTGAGAARIALTPAALPEVQGIVAYASRYGAGKRDEAYAKLDEQIINLVRQQDRLVLNNMNRVRIITLPLGVARPGALLALPLRHENTFYGVFWLAFDEPHNFSEDEIRFMSTLASQTALAVTNTRLFLNAEVGRQRLASILASTPDPVLVTDHQNRLLLSNPAAWQVLHLSGETSEGMAIDRIIFHPELVELLQASANEKNSAEITVAGQRVFLATASSVIAGGRQVGRVCVMRDVTQFKELDALKSEFVATVSHDLRSPLTLMRGYATMLEMVGELNEQQSGYVTKIIQGVESMARLVNNLLDLGRIEAGVDLQLEMVSVEDILNRVTSAIQLQATQKQIQLNTEITPMAIPPIQADSALLTQALQNLLENAVKYTDPGGKVQVGVKLQSDSVVFEITDTGIGIAPVDQPRLFEKFYRGAQRDARKRQGSGLGLAIVKSIAERHHGRVWLHSQLGKGSTFSMEIPLRQTVVAS